MNQGERGFRSAADAKASVEARGVGSYAIMHDPRRNEFAWVPLEVYKQRAIPAMLAGLQTVAIVEAKA